MFVTSHGGYHCPWLEDWIVSFESGHRRQSAVSPDGALLPWFMCKNTCFDVFLIKNLFFRRTDPVPAFEAISFSPSDAVGLFRECTGLGSLSSASRTLDAAVSLVPSSPVRRKTSAAASPACDWPESRNTAPSQNAVTEYD